MQYIYKMEVNQIVTDNLAELISGPLVVYVDNILVGTFENESDDDNYIAFTLQPEQLISLNNAEGQLKIYNYDKLIKQELISVLDFDSKKPTKIKQKNNSIKYYSK